MHFIILEPQAEKFIMRFFSAKEFLHNQKIWCFWLINAEPAVLNKCPLLLKRIEKVRQFRLTSTKKTTVKWAEISTLFTENRRPACDYILVPRNSSESRKYIPFGYFTKDQIIGDSCSSIANTTRFHFGVL